MKKSRPTKTAARAAPAVSDKARTLQLELAPGKTGARQMADLLGQGVVTNALTAMRFTRTDLPDLALTDVVESLRESGQAINRGDLAAAEAMLTAQSLALNVVFAELARVSQLNMLTHPEVADRYLRLALKAQSQSRATVETLAAIKNPPVFARQANVNHGGQFQVNNAAGPPTELASAHAEKTISEPTELLQDLNDGRTQLDTRATPAAGRENPRLEPVGAVNRAAHS